jgi:hypothetical protein
MTKLYLQGLLAGLGVFIVSIGVSFLSQLLVPSLTAEYTNPSLFRPWTDPIMSLFYIYPFVLGVILSFVWDKSKKLMTDKLYWKRGLRFGLWYWVAASIAGMFVTYSSFQVSLPLVLSWSIGGLFEAFAAGIILAKVNSFYTSVFSTFAKTHTVETIDTTLTHCQKVCNAIHEKLREKILETHSVCSGFL